MAGRKVRKDVAKNRSKAVKKRYSDFAKEYVANGLNATQAYFAVYPNCKSELTARVNGYRLLTDAYVADLVQKAQAEAAKKTEITRDMLIENLRSIAFADISEMVDENGQMLPFDQMGTHTKAISEIFVDSKSIDEAVIEKRIRIKKYDAIKATEKLFDVLGFDKPKKVEIVERKGWDFGESTE